MKRAQQRRHPDLFESDEPPIALPLDQTKSLVEMVRALVIEIAATSKVERSAMTKITPDHLARTPLSVFPVEGGSAAPQP